MVRCKDCNQEMTVKHESCICDVMVIDGTAYKRITTYHDVNKYCHDCGILNGGVHHFGCDIERCPKCKEQAFVCDCDSNRYVRPENDHELLKEPVHYCSHCDTLYDSSVEDCECDVGSIDGGKSK